MSGDALTIGEVADIAGIATSTLRYYESIGLLPAPTRQSGQRRYSADVLPVLAVIQLCKDAHFSLDEIKTLLYGEGGLPSERWKALARHKMAEVEAIIARALEMKALLEEALVSDALHYELDRVVLKQSS